MKKGFMLSSNSKRLSSDINKKHYDSILKDGTPFN